MTARTEKTDLHALAARLCLEHIGDHDTRGEGFVVVYVRRSQTIDEDDTAEIAACFGVRPAALDYLREADDGWFGLEDALPNGEILEVLCRVMKDGVGYDDCIYLEIVKLADGEPALKVHS